MNKMNEAFQKHKGLIGCITGGDPSMEKTEEYILEMIAGGVDMIEISIPFSDPVAEGSAVQEANLRALAAGATVGRLLEMVGMLRQKTQIPLLFKTYLNPVFHYGYERFFSGCAQVGIQGILVLDLPNEERLEVEGIAQKHGVQLLTMVTPTSQERLEMLVSGADGFIYTLPPQGHGKQGQFQTDTAEMLKRVKEKARVPVVSAGIDTPKQAEQMAAYADGVIVGQSIATLIGKHGGHAGPPIYQLVSEIRTAISGI